MKTRHYTYKNSIVEMIVELVILLLVIGTVVFTLLTFPKLPETVPTHIGATGQVDGYGKKSSLLAMPLLSLITYIGLSILQRFPNVFNYPIEVTENNVDALHSLGIKMIRCMKLFVVLIFAVGTCLFTESAFGRDFPAGYALVAILLVLMSVMIVYYIVKMSKQK